MHIGEQPTKGPKYIIPGIKLKTGHYRARGIKERREGGSREGAIPQPHTLAGTEGGAATRVWVIALPAKRQRLRREGDSEQTKRVERCGGNQPHGSAPQ